MTTFTDVLGGRGVGNVPAHAHDFSEISGSLRVYSADIDSLSADKITSGTISTETITLSGSGIIQSSNYSPGSAGLYVDGSGFAEFQNVTVRGVITSEAGSSLDGSHLNNGTVTGDKIDTATITGTNIASATITGGNIASGTITGANIQNASITGADIDSATITGGNIANLTITATQIDNLTVTGGKIANNTITDGKISDLSVDKLTTGSLTSTTITLSTNGLIRTASSGERIEIQQTSGSDTFVFYTGDAAEGTAGFVRGYIVGSGGTRKAGIDLRSPDVSGSGIDTEAMQVSLRSESQDNTLPAQILLGPVDSADLAQIPEVLITDTAVLQLQDGSVSRPALQFANGTALGLYRSGTNEMAFATSGAWRGAVGSTGHWAFGTGSTGYAMIRNSATEAAPPFTFWNDTDTGIFRHTTDQLGFSCGGTRRVTLSTSAVDVGTGMDVHLQGGTGAQLYYRGAPSAETQTYDAIWNNFSASNHQLARPTSLREKKKFISDADWLADVALRPRRFKYRGGPATWDYGFIVEELVEAEPTLGIWNPTDERYDDYRQRSILAVLAAKNNRLEAKVAKLEKLVDDLTAELAERFERLERAVFA